MSEITKTLKVQTQNKSAAKNIEIYDYKAQMSKMN